jgi:hypothetical protein
LVVANVRTAVVPHCVHGPEAVLVHVSPVDRMTGRLETLTVTPTVGLTCHGGSVRGAHGGGRQYAPVAFFGRKDRKGGRKRR